MREILFRGKRTDTDEWVYGAYVTMHHNDERTHVHHFIIPDGSDLSYGIAIESILAAVDGETICQYTGLKDNNGKMIFEGDIVDYEDEAPGQYEYHDDLIINRGTIEYSEGNFYWTNSVNANFQDSVYNGVADCMVIGNIFDNQELMGEFE